MESVQMVEHHGVASGLRPAGPPPVGAVPGLHRLAIEFPS